MRSIIFIFIAFILGFSGVALSQQKLPVPPTQTDIQLAEIKREQAALKDSMESLRRDQLNYRTEKELLKDSFAANLQTVNIVITIVLGVFAILGYLGLKGVSAVKSDYANELSNLKALKSALEKEIQEIIAEQKSVKSELIEVRQVNETQANQLQVLEIREKVTQLTEAKNYSLALEYIEAGLKIAPKNVPLLSAKAHALLKYWRLAEARGIFEAILTVQPENINAITNVAETLLLEKRSEEFDIFFKNNLEAIKNFRPGLVEYFMTVRRMLDKDIEGMKAAISPFVNQFGDGAATRLGSWRFTEIRFLLRSEPDSPAKALMLKITDFLEGKVTTQDAKALLGIPSPKAAV